MRKEIKYEFPLGLNINLEKYLLINSCKEIYESRKVNSIYYDDHDFTLFNQNLDGIGFREKYRCRFYNEGQEGINIENKLKLNEFNEKKFLKKEDIGNKSKNRNQNDFILNISETSSLTLPALIQSNYSPKVYVAYKRKYFISRFAKVRLTIDTNITFSKIKLIKNHLFLSANRSLNHNILEIKFQDDSSEVAKLISKITNEFNLTFSKCSKYTKAIELIY